MTTPSAKAPVIPAINQARLTCADMQYAAADPDSHHVVTTNNERPLVPVDWKSGH